MSRYLSLIAAALAVLLSIPFPAPAAEDAAIQKAVDRGVAFLKSQRADDGMWGLGAQRTGYTSLACLALLACDTPITDPIIQKAGELVRRGAVRETETYCIALSILFLDRLGQERDVSLIQSMTLRLLAGQNDQGGWTYTCPSPSEAEATWLTNSGARKSELVTEPGTGQPRKPHPGEELPKEIQQGLHSLGKAISGNIADQTMAQLRQDNSNTQFAILGLWTARRYGMPVEKALIKVDDRFRGSQHFDGGWGYAYYPGRAGQSTATMTCAGVLGLGIAWAAVQEAKAPGKPIPNLKKDPAIQQALQALGTTMNENDFRVNEQSRLFYYLWSLERVAVAYGLNTLGKKDWYAWGSKALLATQNPDGSWTGAYYMCGADTAFALLFLKRANLAEDLSTTLRGKAQDPGEIVLKSGGVGIPNLEGGNVPSLSANEKANPHDGKPAEQGTTAAVAGEAGQLVEQLTKSGGGRSVDVLNKLRDGKGVDYTLALANVIPKLEGELQKEARQALAERFARMTAATLQARMSDENPEIRRAAALGCAMREEKSLIPDLIELLKDSEPRVVRAVHASLKSLSGQDFGPTASADAAERDRAIAAWKEWWSKEGKK